MLVQGDCYEIIPTLPDNSIHLYLIPRFGSKSKMRKLLPIICSLLFTCCSYEYEGKQYTESDFINLQYVTNGITVDVNTDVLYWYTGSSSACPIFKADGTCLTLTEWKNQKSGEIK